MTVDEIIKKQNDICNLTEWHNNGITGENISVWNCEDLSNHGQVTRRRIFDSAPKATVINETLSAKYSVDTVEYVDAGDREITAEEFIKQNNIKILSRSFESNFAGKNELAYREYWEELQKKYNLIIFNSAGNMGAEEDNREDGYDLAIQVGALNSYYEPTSYSSVTDDVDFSDFTGVWQGTSFSCPYLAGKCALLLERYGEMTQTEIFKYFKMCTIDVHEEGKDNKTGWGLVVLPKFGKNYITMTTKEKIYYVNGNAYQMDTKPVNKEGRVFVPIRVIAESLGAEVNWSKNKDKSIKVLIDKGDIHIELNTGSDVAYINGTKDILDFAPCIDENGRTLVPIRFIAESFGCKVDWVQKEAKVMILEQ